MREGRFYPVQFGDLSMVGVIIAGNRQGDACFSAHAHKVAIDGLFVSAPATDFQKYVSPGCARNNRPYRGDYNISPSLVIDIHDPVGGCPRTAVSGCPNGRLTTTHTVSSPCLPGCGLNMLSPLSGIHLLGVYVMN